MNGRDLSYEEMSTFGLSAYTENGTFSLNGTVNIGFDQTSMIVVTCNVSNDFGSDTENTLISMCSKYIVIQLSIVLLSGGRGGRRKPPPPTKQILLQIVV